MPSVRRWNGDGGLECWNGANALSSGLANEQPLEAKQTRRMNCPPMALVHIR
jgi:hypothetical protein